MICHTVRTLARPKVDDWDQSSPDVFRILGQPVATRLSWYGDGGMGRLGTQDMSRTGCSMVQLCRPKAAQKAARGCDDRESDHDSDRHHRPRAVKNFIEF